MTQVTLYIAASLDGYIARCNGDIDWLSRVEVAGEDYSYAAFYESVDAIALGSHTYELVLSFDQWAYPGKQSFVFTQRPLTTDRSDVLFMADPVEQAIAQISAQGFQHLWLVGGGALINSFLQHDLIDRFIISTIPVILGEGIPLFPPPTPELSLELIHSESYPSGLVQTWYQRNRGVSRGVDG